MQNEPELLYGYTSYCNGCPKHCKTGITKQYDTIFRPVINGKIIYDYTIHRRWTSECYDTISFNATSAQDEINFLTKYCAHKCKNHPLGKTR